MINSIILNGKKLAQDIEEKIKNRVAQYARAPGLAVVMIGDNPASEVYVAHKQKACARVGIHSTRYNLLSSVSELEVLQLIQELNQDPIVDGILVQLPLPSHLSTWDISQAIDPCKDVDGFHALHVGQLALRQPSIRPCTPKGVMRLFAEYGIDLLGQHVVIVGASNIVGRPMALECLLAGATVTVCHRFTKDLESFVRQGDIVISATGKPGLIDSTWLKLGSVVCDIGITRLPNGEIVGDIDFESALPRVSAITPVPGGVGPMTVAMLLENTIECYEKRL